MSTAILITGGNRGLGKGLVATYLSAPNTTVIATVRDPSKSESLSALPKAPGSSLIVLKLEISSVDSVNAAIDTLKAHDIDTLDVVIANAGISGPTTSLADAPISELQNYIDVNAFGPFKLFKAVLPLLRSSSSGNKAKFVLISSAGGSLTAMYNFNTDMAREGLDLAKSLGFDLSSVCFTPPEESARAIKSLIDGATVKISGKFLDHDGSELAW
ncbi:hypothetical protein BBP40_005412 [Aspergillus hancockii]|nr:hypothetical protein BBP40_005412 [Aspergillus hancockii]